MNITRRFCFLFLSVVGIYLTAGGFAVVEAEQSPNVLVIITDEHNFRTLGCYREQMPTEQAEMWGPNSVVETPNIDRIAHEGVICTRAYATAPVCSPCRAAMITGLYPQNTGVPTNNKILRDDVPTLAKILARRGYRTSFIGKWHLGGEGKPEWAPKVDGGFQHKQFMFNRGHWKKFELGADGPRVAARDKAGNPSYDVDNADENSFSTDFLTDRTIEFVNRSEDQPFLAVVSYPDPHGPNTVRQPYDHMYDHLRFLAPRTYGRDEFAKPKWIAGDKNHAKFRGDDMSRYFGMVKCIDDNIGRLLAALEQSGRLDSTIVLMTSDHGDLCYEHDRLNKGNPYEGSARVPMLFRFPSKLSKETVYKYPVGTVDVTPTLLGLAKIQVDAKFQGRDLSSHLSGETREGEHPLTFLRNSGMSAQWIAAVDDRYKLILSVNDRPWLFDMERDPDELLNLYGRPGTQEITRRLARGLRQYATANADPHAENAKIAESLAQCLGASE